MKKIIETDVGPIHVELIDLPDRNAKQLNVYHSPNGEVGFFLIFPSNLASNIEKAAIDLIESNIPLEEDSDITSRVDGCLMAHTMKKITFEKKLVFGQPSIALLSSSEVVND